MSRSFGSRLVIASVACAMFAVHVPRSIGQESPADSPIDRLKHPDGTVTGRAGIAHVERRGTGPIPVLLIPGAPFGWRAWEWFMERNEKRYTMWAITPAGYDDSPPAPMPAPKDADDFTKRPWTDALLADLVKLIETEMTAAGKLGPPVIVGHHLMSDYYAVRLAHEHPSLVRAVVSVAGLGTFPISGDPANAEPGARARYVRESRVPFFRTVAQTTWNANTFPANSLSIDPEHGKELFEAEIAVPIETQLRYYLEYATDELEPHVAAMKAPLLALQLEPKMGFENLSQSMKDQVIKRFGSLEEARKALRFGGPWEALVSKLPAERAQVSNVPNTGSFMMDDVPELFDNTLAEFIRTHASAAPSPGGKK